LQARTNGAASRGGRGRIGHGQTRNGRKLTDKGLVRVGRPLWLRRWWFR
jgi:hypothetical protein